MAATQGPGSSGGHGCEEAHRACGRTCFVVPSKLTAEPSNLAFCAGKAWSAYCQGDLQHAESMVTLLTQQAAPIEELGWLLVAQNLRGLLLLAYGRTEEASVLFSEMAEAANREPLQLMEQLLDGLFGWAIALYDLQEHSEFDEVAGTYQQLRYLDCRCHWALRGAILTGLKDLWGGRYTQATLAFHAVRRYLFVDTGHYFIVGLLGLAEVAAIQGDVAGALEQLDQIAFYLDRGHGQGAVLTWLGRFPNARRLARAHYPEWPTESQPATSLARTLGIRKPDADLRLHGFGMGQIFVQGQPISPQGLSRIDLALLILLATEQGTVEVSRLRMLLWPEAESESPLDKSLARLRAAIGSRFLPKQENGVIKLATDAWLDIAHYEAAFARTHQAELDHRMDGLMSCVALYPAPFLQGFHNAWVEEQRRHFQEMAARVYYELAALYDLDGQLPESVRYLELALQVDPLFDAGMAALIRQLDRMGNRSAAAARARAYRLRIKQTLGIEPSVELLSLLERFTSEPSRELTGAFTLKNVLLARTRAPRPPAGSVLAGVGPVALPAPRSHPASLPRVRPPAEFAGLEDVDGGAQGGIADELGDGGWGGQDSSFLNATSGQTSWPPRPGGGGRSA